MAESHSLTGYGPSHNLGRYSRLVFDGDERRYEQWEVKRLGYLKLRKLKATILALKMKTSMRTKMRKHMQSKSNVWMKRASP